jgi:hypothetical protein
MSSKIVSSSMAKRKKHSNTVFRHIHQWMTGEGQHLLVAGATMRTTTAD